MNLNILLRGQSNAVLFASEGGLAEVKAQVQALLGFNGVTDTITLVASQGGGSANTMVAGTALLTDWLAPRNGDWHQGWTTGPLEQGLLDAIAALSPAARASPTAVLWLHNEYDGAQPGLVAAQWASALRYDAALLRQAFGQAAAQLPYLFVNAIPYSNANWDSNQQIRIAMQALAADAGFNAKVAAQAADVNMDAGNTAMGGAHLGDVDIATLAGRLARSVAESFAGYAKTGSPVALAAGQLDDSGPHVVAAALVAGHANQLVLTVGFDQASALLPLDAVAAGGANWFVNTAAQASGGQWATGARLLDAGHLVLSFATPLPAGSLLFYGYGYGKVWAPDGAGETHGIYDNNGMPLWAAASGVAVSAAVALPAAGAAASGVIGAGPNRLVLRISEDAWNGDALYTVKVDGVQVGGTFAAHAQHGVAPAEQVTLAGSWGAGPHQVTVTFLNDAWGGTAQTDRNLYVEGISLDGAVAVSGSAAMLSGGVANFNPAGGTGLAGAGYGLAWRQDFSTQSRLDANRFPVSWGLAADMVFADGMLTLTSRAAEGWRDVGFMQPDFGAGYSQGYGLYQVTARLQAGQGAGICILLWPADNLWPGPEMDLLESWDASRQSGFAAIHWKGGDGSNQYDLQGVSLDLTQWHNYALDWAPGRLTYYVDGVQLFSTTQHVPLDAAHGGINASFGAEVTAAGSNPVSAEVTLHLREMSYAVPVVPAAAPLAAVTLEAMGATSLVQAGGRYLLLDAHGAGPALSYLGQQVVPGQLGAWVPLGAAAAGSGYQLAWRNGAADEYLVWNLDAAGAFSSAATGLVGGGSLALQRLETSFGQDLNGDGNIGPRTTVIRTNGAVTLESIGGVYHLAAGGSVVAVKLAGAEMAEGGVGAWVPLGAAAAGSGYQLAWKLGAADQYLVWNLDAAGSYTGGATELVGGGNLALQRLETAFGQDLNGDGGIGPRTSVIHSNGGVTLESIGGVYHLAGGSVVPVTYAGAEATEGLYSAWVPLGAAAAGSGYQLAWKNGAADQYIVWNLDAAGHFTGAATGQVGHADPGLQRIETSFGQDLNGDGHVGSWLL